MIGEMGAFGIEYRSGVTQSLDSCSIHVHVGSKKELQKASSTRCYSMNLRETSIYDDLYDHLPKVVASSMLWDDCKEVWITLSNKSLTAQVAHLEHTLVNICMALAENVDMLERKWVIAHERKQPSKAVRIIVEKLKKVFAGKLLALLPANVATPTMLCETLSHLFEDVGAKTQVMNVDALTSAGFGLITGVGTSANTPPCMLIVQRHAKGAARKRIGLVGKGVTFDTGGLAIKSLRHMSDMKYDKIGAVYGAMVLLYFMENEAYHDVDFVGVFPFVENAVSEKAMHPGDVLKSYSGITVEVTNPDAEGRLILADAFAFIQEFELDFLIDIATLTGHASSATCWHSAMAFTRSKSMAARVMELGESIGERVLTLPYWKEHRKVLKSAVADITNSPQKCGDSAVASMFLSEFVSPKLPWVHLDLAHETDGDMPKGHGMRIAMRIIEDVCEKK